MYRILHGLMSQQEHDDVLYILYGVISQQEHDDVLYILYGVMNQQEHDDVLYILYVSAWDKGPIVHVLPHNM